MNLFATSIDPHIETIDLHGCDNKVQALEKLEQELFLVYKKDAQYCRVVYGIGGGVLRSAVLAALEKNPMVKEVQEEGGACLVGF